MSFESVETQKRQILKIFRAKFSILPKVLLMKVLGIFGKIWKILGQNFPDFLKIWDFQAKNGYFWGLDDGVGGHF